MLNLNGNNTKEIEKIDFYFFRARQVFETTFGHVQKFWQKQIFHIVLYLF